MKVCKKYFKNSNTGELIYKTWYEETRIKNMLVNFYNIHGKSVENPDLTGFVEMSEKKFEREKKFQLKLLK